MRVDFYLLETNDRQQRFLLACRLLEKAYLRGHRAFVFCQNQADAELLDELLWTFKDDSFIPHNLQGEGPEPPPAIQIGFQTEPRAYHDILLNLAAEIPSFYQKFNRVIEIVLDSEDAKAVSREHYRIYRSQNCALHHHKLNLSEAVVDA